MDAGFACLIPESEKGKQLTKNIFLLANWLRQFVGSALRISRRRIALVLIEQIAAVDCVVRMTY